MYIYHAISTCMLTADDIGLWTNGLRVAQCEALSHDDAGGYTL